MMAHTYHKMKIAIKGGECACAFNLTFVLPPRLVEALLFCFRDLSPSHDVDEGISRVPINDRGIVL